MNSTPARPSAAVMVALCAILAPDAVCAATTVFFDISQKTNLVASGTTSDTMSSEGYLFTFTRDKLFTGGFGLTNPIGRTVRIPWPDGLEAQAVTAGPAPSGAKISISRQDHQTFAIDAFTAKLLANTAGAGGSFEIMPMLNGEDGLSDPVMFDATGIAGNQFIYQTPALSGFDAYKITLYVDYALMRLTVVDASPPPPSLTISRTTPGAVEIAWPANAVGYALEYTTNLSTQVWQPVTSRVGTNGDLCTVQVEISRSNSQYRLRKYHGGAGIRDPMVR